MTQAERKSIRLKQSNIVLSVIDEVSLSFAAAGQASWDVVELRLDLLAGIPGLTIEGRSLGEPIILTARHPDEGGNPGISSDEDRAQLISPLVTQAAAIDVEIAHAGAMERSIKEARDNGAALILSTHDFERTPSAGDLSDSVQRGIDLGADVVKVASYARDEAGVQRLLSLLDAFTEQPLAVMAMGPLGKDSRLQAARAGSVLNYACHAVAGVEGQWQAAEFAAALEERGLR